MGPNALEFDFIAFIASIFTAVGLPCPLWASDVDTEIELVRLINWCFVIAIIVDFDIVIDRSGSNIDRSIIDVLMLPSTTIIASESQVRQISNDA